MTYETDIIEPKQPERFWQSWVSGLLLILILASGAYLRLTGIDWDEEQHLHPDERFLTMVESSLEPINTDPNELGPPPSVATQSWRGNYVGVLRDCEEWGGYFDTACSSLNPNNRGYDFYVYGTLPIFIVRYAAEFQEQTGYGDVYLVGRFLSAVSDLLTILLVYAIATKIYNQRVAVLASAFSAVSVLLIQQSHFFTVDTFTNFFIMLALYFAVTIAVSRPQLKENRQLIEAKDSGLVKDYQEESDDRKNTFKQIFNSFVSHPLFCPSLFFGAVLGMAVASKINAAPLAITLPGAALIYLFRLSPRNRNKQSLQVFAYLVLAGIVSVVAFRVFQPYAFSGPGFFGIKPNKAWIDDLSALRAQTGGDVDFPPALQWARRPGWFSFQNLVLWGLGLPLGVLSWAGFIWMGWRILKGGWKEHGLLWGWTAVYFVWQSNQWNSTLRYQLPIYPLLAIFGAWLLIFLWDKAKRFQRPKLILSRSLVFVVGALVMGMTALWAYGFSQIYVRPHTRVEATRWLFQHMPGAVNLSIQSEDEIYNQPLSYPAGSTIRAGLPQQLRFTALADGTLTDIYIPHAVDKAAVSEMGLILSVSPAFADIVLTTEVITADEIRAGGGESTGYPLTAPVTLTEGEAFALTLDRLDDYSDVSVCGQVMVDIQTINGLIQQVLPILSSCIQGMQMPYTYEFVPEVDGILQQVVMWVQPEPRDQEVGLKTLTLEVLDPAGNIIGMGEVSSEFSVSSDPRGDAVRIPLSSEATFIEGQAYSIQFSLGSGSGVIAFSGTSMANESSWDDGLPLRMDGYDPYGGIYQGGLNFEMYWDDNEDKYERFVSTLDQTDTILITSSRQWGSTTRVQERYPLTTEYYNRLLGCPADHSIEWCYNVAQPGSFQGDLGFELVKTFQSDPSVGEFEINDQFAEEAFTVYDHPKVFVFNKTEDYDPDRVREILGAIDLSKVIRVTPKQADAHPGDLQLPAGRLEEQRSGGTWSDYFNPDGLQNRVQILGVLLWYLGVGLLGLVVYPLVRFAMPGLSDRGYPLSRITGLLLLSVLVWLAGSVRIPFSRLTIGLALLLILLLSGYLSYIQRDELRKEIKERWKYFLRIEGLFLVFFLMGLLIRLGNPDLWHPWKGGEKPMDFSYFNAVLKSTSFPPYDPWFAGGYINYYYYGFMLVGVLVKFLGILPSIAYNLILPTILSIIALGAFSIVWNLMSSNSQSVDDGGGSEFGYSGIPSYAGGRKMPIIHPRQFNQGSIRLIASLSGALLMAVLGNLGILQMFTRGMQMNVVSSAEIDAAGFFSKLIWTITGLFKTVTGTMIPIRMDEWYWNPSRVIGYQHGNPITEFPFFTFLYGDLHAHLIALPVSLLVVTWVMSVVKGRAWESSGRRSWLQIGLGMSIGGLAIGALYPINLSDIYTYLPLGISALAYAIWRYVEFKEQSPGSIGLSKFMKRLIWIGLGAVALYALSQLLYQPYSHWYGQGYSEVKIWDGTHTPMMQYLTHWGVFLFVIVSWLFYESIDWMATTPASALRKLEPYRGLILTGLSLLVIAVLFLGVNLYPEGLPQDALPVGLGIHIAWLALPLAAWAGVLLLRPGFSDSKRMVLFFIGTGLVLTLMVEIIVVTGDIGRMNTVFKFYLQTWTLFAVSSGAALGWLIQGLPKWSIQWRTIWQIFLGFIVSVAALYPLLGSIAKIGDRMESSAPYTLDGMTYMQYATYHDEGVAMDLSQDYNGIRWLQDNLEGSPVIVEANSVEYHWGTRYTIYTGLPGVVGWNWHQRQQRTSTPHDWVFERVESVHEFYQTEDLEWAQDFLQRYDVSYIILGQLEQAKYPGPGLEKFSDQDGLLWQEVFRDRDTVIYEVIKGQNQ